MGAVDVNDVERDGDPGGATNLGDELIGNQMRRHLVQDPCDLERQRMIAAELAGSLKRHRGNLPETDPGRRSVSASRSCSALLSTCRVGKWRYRVDRPTPAAAAISDMLPGDRRRASRLREDPAAALGGVSAQNDRLVHERRPSCGLPGCSYRRTRRTMRPTRESRLLLHRNLCPACPSSVQV